MATHPDEKKKIYLIDLGYLEEAGSKGEKEEWYKNAMATLRKKAGTGKVKTPSVSRKRHKLGA